MRSIPSWVWLAAALLAAGLLGLVQIGRPASPPLDIHSAAPNGALALARWLQQAGYDLRTVTSRDLSVGSLPRGSVMFILSPATDMTAAQAKSLERWAGRGGRVVLVTDGTTGAPLLQRLGATVVPALPERVRVVQPLLTAPLVASLAGDTSAVVGVSRDGVTVAEADEGAVLVRWARGQGVIWVLTAGQLLQNGSIGQGQNRGLALNLAGPRGGTVVIDQFTLPPVSTPTNIMDTTWGVALLLAAAVIVLYRFLSGWRLGPALPSPEAAPRPAVEYVISLAGVMQRARARQEVLRLYQRRLGAVVRRRSVPDAVLKPLLTEPPHLTENDLVWRAEAMVALEEELRRNRD